MLANENHFVTVKTADQILANKKFSKSRSLKIVWQQVFRWKNFRRTNHPLVLSDELINVVSIFFFLRAREKKKSWEDVCFRITWIKVARILQFEFEWEIWFVRIKEIFEL